MRTVEPRGHLAIRLELKGLLLHAPLRRLQHGGLHALELGRDGRRSRARVGQRERQLGRVGAARHGRGAGGDVARANVDAEWHALALPLEIPTRRLVSIFVLFLRGLGRCRGWM